MKERDFISSLLWVLEKLLIVIACVSFLLGGLLLHAETPLSRFSGELIGIGFALVCRYLAREINSLSKRIIKEHSDASTSSLD